MLITAVLHSLFLVKILYSFFSGMNAAVRAVVRMGLYVGAKVYFIHEVSPYSEIIKAFIPLVIVYFIRKK